MYVVTFYSFKGGVGRTLALANVGTDLARRGRKVLLVDFDLEAPGLDSFSSLAPKRPQAGLVDYVSSYMTTGTVPRVEDHVYEAHNIADKGGRLLIMPAGRQDPYYGAKLQSIRWSDLYEERNGFLMFEDLRAQWRASLGVDYVLVDSRTGHTDVGSICTRQLPDAVVILFFPNEQNLVGLRRVVNAIRRDATEGSSGKPRLSFVMSNVPDLDDEENILSQIQARFQTELRYDSLEGTIYRYDSLMLLQQDLFILKRPKSRLAKEYAALTDSLIEHNVEDREGALRRLNGHRRRTLSHGAVDMQKRDIDAIITHHANDGEILFSASRALESSGNVEEAGMLLDRCAALGYRKPSVLLKLAERELRRSNPAAAVDAALELLQSPEVETRVLIRASEMLRQLAPERLMEATASPAFRRLNLVDAAFLAQQLSWGCDELRASVQLLNFIPETETDARLRDIRRNSLALVLIGLGRFSEAIALWGKARPDPSVMSIVDCFNYGMAEWGHTHRPPTDMLQQVIELDKVSEKTNDSPNRMQCLAISLCLVGRRDHALARLTQAQEAMQRRAMPEFSCWRYLMTTPEAFLEDCQEIRRFINGEAILPRFLGQD